MVTPYPPLRDGIANYAVQMVAQLMRDGHDVRVLSPGPSAAHEHLDLFGPRGALALGRRLAEYDKVVVQWHPVFFYASHASRYRTQTDLALWAAFRRARSVEVWMHEFEYDDVRRLGPRRAAALQLWREVDRIYFHSAAERERFLAVVPVDPAKAVLGEHGAAFLKRTSRTKEQARESLGLPPDAFCLLSIGFVQRHKGFDRAIKAFAGLAEHGARLDVVGSIRVDEPDFVAYRDELSDLTRRVEGTHFHPGYVSDELFDRWIVASDVVVLPYREIWSSGVLERAALYHRPVIATKVGGLAHQAADRRVELVDDDDGLRAAMWRSAGVPLPDGRGTWASPADPQQLWAGVQAEVLQRAAEARGDLPIAGPSHSSEPDRPGPTTGRPSVPDLVDARRRALAWSAPLRRLPAYVPPAATSARPGAAAAKRLVRRLTGWELEPLAHQLQALHSATVRAIEDAAEDLAGDGR